MAHLSEDGLPSEFDVIVDGTGLVESILAAALARCGKSVLHLDRNGFYGELWASLMHREFHPWLQNVCSSSSSTNVGTDDCIAIKEPSSCIDNVIQAIHGPEKTPSKSSNCDSVPEERGVSQDDPPSEAELPGVMHSSLLSWKSLDPVKRRLVYDICPKVLACRGTMVDLLTKSNCSRYVEFKAVSKICIYQSGTIEQVPCSRADVFGSKSVSMLEKRKMMKFLSYCSTYDEDSNLEEIQKLTFVEFLRNSDLTESLIRYVLLCIAMADENTPALEGLKSAKLFLNSLGRFENAPFLFPIFGSGELPQAYCRMCAVFGGVYCLKRSIGVLDLAESSAGDRYVSGIVCSNGQKITCSDVVCGSYSMRKTFEIQSNVKVSRAVLLVDRPLCNTDGKVTLLTIPPFSAGADQTCAVRLLQLDPSTNTAVDGTYMVHLMARSVGATAKQDLESTVQLLYNSQNECENDMEKPLVLWSVYFNLNMCKVDQQNDAKKLPTNLHLTSDPDYTITHESAIEEAKLIFKKLCPDKEFLESPPEPDEIVYE